jgi:hypothetical protein
MPRDERVALIERIEKLRESRGVRSASRRSDPRCRGASMAASVRHPLRVNCSHNASERGYATCDSKMEAVELLRSQNGGRAARHRLVLVSHEPAVWVGGGSGRKRRTGCGISSRT